LKSFENETKKGLSDIVILPASGTQTPLGGYHFDTPYYCLKNFCSTFVTTTAALTQNTDTDWLSGRL